MYIHTSICNYLLDRNVLLVIFHNNSLSDLCTDGISKSTEPKLR